MPVTFVLSDKQDLDIARWEHSHEKECEVKVPTWKRRGMFTFRFTPTELGTVVAVECCCGLRKDVTEYH